MYTVIKDRGKELHVYSLPVNFGFVICSSHLKQCLHMSTVKKFCSENWMVYSHCLAVVLTFGSVLDTGCWKAAMHLSSGITGKLKLI